MVERLFLPFTRLDDRTRHDGFGLGLALVSSIAAVHGGTVHATAVPAGGLDITVRLPRRDNAATPASPAIVNTAAAVRSRVRPGSAIRGALPQLVAAAGQGGGFGGVARQLDGFVVRRA